MPHRRLKTKPVDGGKYEYEKVFGEDTFAAAGVIRIPAGSKKPGKSSRDNAFVSLFFLDYMMVWRLTSSSFSFTKGV
jgi:hypothetical protein